LTTSGKEFLLILQFKSLEKRLFFMLSTTASNRSIMELKWSCDFMILLINDSSNRTIMELKWRLEVYRDGKICFFQSHHHGIEIKKSQGHEQIK